MLPAKFGGTFEGDAATILQVLYVHVNACMRMYVHVCACMYVHVNACMYMGMHVQCVCVASNPSLSRCRHLQVLLFLVPLLLRVSQARMQRRVANVVNFKLPPRQTETAAAAAPPAVPAVPAK